MDETGATLALTRRDARAPRGQRARGRVPRNHGPPPTVIAARGLAGLPARHPWRGAVTGDKFLASGRDGPGPASRPGPVVVLDNLSRHKGAAVREAIAAARGRRLFLPSDSPACAPIERACTQGKAGRRALGARTPTGWEAAVAHARPAITPGDAHGWFRHCGYHP